MSLTVIGIIILSVLGASESLLGSLFAIIIVGAMVLGLATEFGFISPP
jgi:hypothetical protein